MKYPAGAKEHRNEDGDLMVVWKSDDEGVMMVHLPDAQPEPFRFNVKVYKENRTGWRTTWLIGVVLTDAFISRVAGLSASSARIIMRNSELDFILQCASEFGVE